MSRMQGDSYLMHGVDVSETLIVKRAANVRWIEGKPVETNIEPYEMIGNVQPFSPKDLLLVPEAQRTKEMLWIFTEQNTKIPQNNDHVIRNGIYFQVQGVENWGTYSRIRVVREDVGAQASR